MGPAELACMLGGLGGAVVLVTLLLLRSRYLDKADRCPRCKATEFTLTHVKGVGADRTETRLCNRCGNVWEVRVPSSW